MLGLSFQAVFHKRHLSSSPKANWLPEKSSCSKILLAIHMRPAAIGLNDSIKKHMEQHMGVRQICVYVYVQEIKM